MNGGNTQVDVNNLFEAFLTGGIAVKAILPIGEHKAIFKGLTIDAKTMKFTIKFTVEGKDYEHNVQFKPERAEHITWMFQDLARQLGLEGNVAFEDYNKYIDKEFTVWAVKVEGYTGVFYNYKAPKTTEVAATPVDTPEETDF